MRLVINVPRRETGNATDKGKESAVAGGTSSLRNVKRTTMGRSYLNENRQLLIGKGFRDLVVNREKQAITLTTERIFASAQLDVVLVHLLRLERLCARSTCKQHLALRAAVVDHGLLALEALSAAALAHHRKEDWVAEALNNQQSSR